MPRVARTDFGGTCYHVLNRGNERQTIFHDDTEYESFLQLLERARQRQDMRVLAYCLMSNHFHLCLWPKADRDLGRFMQWLTTAHVAMYRKSRPGAGHVWQGRFKSSPTQDDGHLLVVMRYILRNPVRAGLVASPGEWRWSSAREKPAGNQGVLIHTPPLELPRDWRELIDAPGAVDEIRACIQHGSPFGDATWAARWSSD
jgi:putative transposase